MLGYMLFQIRKIITFQMYQLSAFNAFQMKMQAAFLAVPHILKTCDFNLLAQVFSDASVLHQLFQGAVYGGLAYLCALLFQDNGYFVCGKVLRLVIYKTVKNLRTLSGLICFLFFLHL